MPWMRLLSVDKRMGSLLFQDELSGGAICDGCMCVRCVLGLAWRRVMIPE